MQSNIHIVILPREVEKIACNLTYTVFMWLISKLFKIFQNWFYFRQVFTKHKATVTSFPFDYSGVVWLTNNSKFCLSGLVFNCSSFDLWYCFINTLKLRFDFIGVIMQQMSNASDTIQLTLLLPRLSYNDLVFSVFSSNFFPRSYKIILPKNGFVTLFIIQFYKKFKRSRLIPHASEDENFVP